MFVISLTTKLYSSRCSGRRGAVNSHFTPIYVRELYKLLLARVSYQWNGFIDSMVSAARSCKLISPIF